MRYLAIHDPEMLRHAKRVQGQYERPSIHMKRHLRKTIGETHWRRYLDFYNLCYKTADPINIGTTEAHTAAPPPFPTLSKQLDKDVTEVIFSFLDGKSMYEASKVSRAFRDALIPRQRNVTIVGFPSFAAFRRMNFLGMEYFSGGASRLITDSTLDIIANDRTSYPNLACVAVGRCAKLSAKAEVSFVWDMGPRLERFSGYYS